MITNAEAISRLDAMRRENPMLLCADVNAIDMAIAALEKQEGKNPIAVNAKSTWAKCPICGSTDIDEYCEKCGQKILWEE